MSFLLGRAFPFPFVNGLKFATAAFAAKILSPVLRSEALSAKTCTVGFGVALSHRAKLGRKAEQEDRKPGSKYRRPVGHSFTKCPRFIYRTALPVKPKGDASSGDEGHDERYRPSAAKLIAVALPLEALDGNGVGRLSDPHWGHSPLALDQGKARAIGGAR